MTKDQYLELLANQKQILNYLHLLLYNKKGTDAIGKVAGESEFVGDLFCQPSSSKIEYDPDHYKKDPHP